MQWDFPRPQICERLHTNIYMEHSPHMLNTDGQINVLEHSEMNQVILQLCMEPKLAVGGGAQWSTYTMHKIRCVLEIHTQPI